MRDLHPRDLGLNYMTLHQGRIDTPLTVLI